VESRVNLGESPFLKFQRLGIYLQQKMSKINELHEKMIVLVYLLVELTEEQILKARAESQQEFLTVHNRNEKWDASEVEDEYLESDRRDTGRNYKFY
jgi:hypothetical protein